MIIRQFMLKGSVVYISDYSKVTNGYYLIDKVVDYFFSIKYSYLVETTYSVYPFSWAYEHLVECAV